LEQLHGKSSKKKLTLFVLEPVNRIDLSKVLWCGAKRAIHQDVGAFEEKIKLFICSEDNNALRNVIIGVSNMIGKKITFVVHSLLITPGDVEID
jgi:hypothetical protein